MTGAPEMGNRNLWLTGRASNVAKVDMRFCQCRIDSQRSLKRGLCLRQLLLHQQGHAQIVMGFSRTGAPG